MISGSAGARASAGIALTPAIQIGMDLLRLSPQELTARLWAEAEANPLLLWQGPEPEASATPEGLRAPEAPEALARSLRSQIAAKTQDKSARALAEYLIEILDARGFLTQSRAEIAVETRFPLAIVDAGIALLTSCEPAGIGARNLTQCLSLQLQRRGLSVLRAERVVEAYGPLTMGDWTTARSFIDASDAELRAYAEMLNDLHLDPAAVLREKPVAPEAADLRILPRADGGLDLLPVEGWAPKLSIDRILRAQGQARAESRPFVDSQVRAAEALIRGVAFRKQTITRLGRYLTEAQAGYFRGQSPMPQPLTRAAAAAALEVHATTVGRALRGGTLEFEGRVLGLDWFFPRRLEGAEISAEGAQALLRQMVSAEPRGEPLSDTALAEEMKKLGVDISRRTVAKYRGALNIPPSHIRRRLAEGLGPRRR